MKETTIEYEGKTIPFFVHDTVLTRFGRLPDFISTTIEQKHTFFELSFLEMMRERSKGAQYFVDCGANIGNHSVFALEVMHCKEAVCFEPYPENVLVLKENMKGKPATVHSVGLSDRPGTMDFDQGFFKGDTLMANAGGTTLVPGSAVEVTTLDSISLPGCDILKIDVEGMEAQVIKGAENTLEKYGPTVYAEANTMNAFVQTITEMISLGYCLTFIGDYGNLMAEFKPQRKI